MRKWVSLYSARAAWIGVLLVALVACNSPSTPVPDNPTNPENELGLAEFTIDCASASVPDGTVSIGITATPLESESGDVVRGVINSPHTTLELSVPAGLTRFTATAYSAADARGTALLSAEVTVEIVAGQANRVVIRFPNVASLTRVEVALDPDFLAPGGNGVATATGYSVADRIIPGVAFTWASSDVSVASISEGGRITAHSVGRTVITAVEPLTGVHGTAQLAVTSTTVVIESLSVAPGRGSIPVGGALSFQVEAYDRDGEAVSGLSFEFMSDNPSVLSVDDQGRAVAASTGSAFVQVSVEGVSSISEIHVTPSSNAPQGHSWQPSVSPLAPEVRGLTISNDGRMYALLSNRFSVSYTGAGTSLITSSDNGESWQPVYTGDLTFTRCYSYNFRSITVSPSDSMVLLLTCTGDQESLVFRSSDGGRAWSEVLALAGTTVARPQFHPLAPDYVFIGELFSNDAGVSWSRSGAQSRLQITTRGAHEWIDFNPTAPQQTRFTQDAGTTWATVQLPAIPDRGFGSCAENPWSWSRTAVSESGRILVAGMHQCNIVSTERYRHSIFQSDDFGEEWTEVSRTEDARSTSWWQSRHFHFSPADENTIYAFGTYAIGAGTNSLQVSSDGGHTWNDHNFAAGNAVQLLRADLVMSVRHPGVLVSRISNVDNRHFVTTDFGASWHELDWVLSVGIGGPLLMDDTTENVYFYGEAVPGVFVVDTATAARDAAPLAGRGLTNLAVDRGTALLNAWNGLQLQGYQSLGIGELYSHRTKDRGDTWQAMNTPSLIAVQSPAELNRWYYALAKGDIYSSDDDGITYNRVGRLPNLAVPSVLAPSHSDADVVYALTAHGVYRSSDAGVTWLWASTHLTHTRQADLVLDPTNHDILYVGGNGVFKSTDGGGGWTQAARGLRNDGIVTLAISSDGGTLYAGAADGSIYRSLDASDSWEWVNQGFESYSVKGIVIDPTDDNVVYASTTGGVYKSVDKGSSWRLASMGIFSPFTTWLAIAQDGATVYVGTEDHGIYRGEPSGNLGDSFTSASKEVLLQQLQLRGQ